MNQSRNPAIPAPSNPNQIGGADQDAEGEDVCKEGGLSRVTRPKLSAAAKSIKRTM